MLEELKEINEVIKNIADFVQNNEKIKPDFEEYVKTRLIKKKKKILLSLK